MCSEATDKPELTPKVNESENVMLCDPALDNFRSSDLVRECVMCNVEKEKVPWITGEEEHKSDPLLDLELNSCADTKHSMVFDCEITAEPKCHGCDTKTEET